MVVNKKSGLEGGKSPVKEEGGGGGGEQSLVVRDGRGSSTARKVG